MFRVMDRVSCIPPVHSSANHFLEYVVSTLRAARVAFLKTICEIGCGAVGVSTPLPWCEVGVRWWARQPAQIPVYLHKSAAGKYLESTR